HAQNYRPFNPARWQWVLEWVEIALIGGCFVLGTLIALVGGADPERANLEDNDPLAPRRPPENRARILTVAARVVAVITFGVAYLVASGKITSYKPPDMQQLSRGSG